MYFTLWSGYFTGHGLWCRQDQLQETHTTSSENDTEKISRNPDHKDMNLLKRLAQVPKEYVLCQEA